MVQFHLFNGCKREWCQTSSKFCKYNRPVKRNSNMSGLIKFFLVSYWLFSLHWCKLIWVGSSSLDNRLPSLSPIANSIMSNNSHFSLILPPSWKEGQLLRSNNFLCSSLVVFLWISKLKLHLSMVQFHLFNGWKREWSSAKLWKYNRPVEKKSSISALITFYVVPCWLFSLHRCNIIWVGSKSSLDVRLPSLSSVIKRIMSNNSHFSLISPPSRKEGQFCGSNNFLCSSFLVFVLISRYRNVT